jgi:hypothetical protein
MPKTKYTIHIYEASSGQLCRSSSEQNFEIQDRDVNVDITSPRAARRVRSQDPAQHNFQVQEKGEVRVRTRQTTAMSHKVWGKRYVMLQ